MRNFGFAGYDRVICIGTNGKLTEACAAMGPKIAGEYRHHSIVVEVEEDAPLTRDELVTMLHSENLFFRTGMPWDEHVISSICGCMRSALKNADAIRSAVAANANISKKQCGQKCDI